MTAGLERHIGRPTARLVAGCLQCIYLGMWFASLPVPAFADHCFTLRNDAAAAWIRWRTVESARGQQHRMSHVDAINCVHDDSSGSRGN